MSIECSILNISALGLLAQSISFSKDFTIHKLLPLLYTSQVYVSKYSFASVLVVKGRLHKALGPISSRRLCYADEA